MAARLASRDELMSFNVRRYYEAHPDAWTIVAAYINGSPLPDGTQPLSLRSIDHFVRTLMPPELARNYGMFKSSRHKQHFDTFRRSERQIITLHGIALETTYAQLAFFMWMMQTGTLELAESSRDELVAAKRRTPNTPSTTKKRRSVLVGPAIASGDAVLSLDAK